MHYESLWNDVFQQGVLIRLKITFHIASSMNNSKNSWSIWFPRVTIFRKKMQKLIHKMPKCFANCELRTANSNSALDSILSCLNKKLSEQVDFDNILNQYIDFCIEVSSTHGKLRNSCLRFLTLKPKILTMEKTKPMMEKQYWKQEFKK